MDKKELSKIEIEMIGKDPKNKVIHRLSDEEIESIESLKKFKRNDISDFDFVQSLYKYGFNLVTLPAQNPYYNFIIGIDRIFKLADIVQNISLENVGKYKVGKLKLKVNKEKILDVEKKLGNILEESIDFKKLPVNIETHQDISFDKSNFGFFDIKESLNSSLFIMIITNLEVYLEDKLKTNLKNNPILFNNFIQKLTKNDWKQISGIKKTPSEYYLNMEKIIFEHYLKFPYHDLKDKVKIVYKQAFDIDVFNFKDFNKLIKFIKKRHKITHRGLELLGMRHYHLEFKELKKIIKIVNDFVYYIEKEVDKKLKNLDELNKTLD